MKQNKTLLAVSLALLFMGFNLHAEVVRNIKIEGLKKTKPSTIENIIGYHVGDQIYRNSDEEIRQKLIKSGLFISETMKVQLQFQEQDADIHLYINDRVTLIPIPVVSYSDDAFSGGIFVAESNFLGLGHSLYLGGLFSLESQMVMLGYTNPSFFGSHFSLGSNAGFYNDEVTVVSVDGDDDLVSYDMTTTNFGLSSGWNLSPFEIGLGVAGSYISTSFSDDDALGVTPDFYLKYDTLYYDTYFTEGIKMQSSYAMQMFSETFDFTQTVAATLSYQMLLAEKWQLQLNSDAGQSWGDELQSLSLDFGSCGSILPSGVLADQFVQTNIKIQYAAFDFNWGYLAVPLAYQVGFMDGISGDNEFFQGPSGGIVLYLKKVAIPAMSLLYSHNLETGTGEVKFNLGVQI